MKGSLLAVFILTSIFCFSQPSVKVYGYSQNFVPGMVKQNDVPDENGGQPAASPRVHTNFYIYISTASTVSISPAAIWIAGKWDTITGLQVVKTPVINEVPAKKQLVAATTKIVRQVSIGDTLRKPIILSSGLRKKINENELVIIYIWKGKKYYAALKKLVVLDPVHGI